MKFRNSDMETLNDIPHSSTLWVFVFRKKSILTQEVVTLNLRVRPGLIFRVVSVTN